MTEVALKFNKYRFIEILFFLITGLALGGAESYVWVLSLMLVLPAVFFAFIDLR